MPSIVHSIIVLGAGSAGLLAALALKKKLPAFVKIEVIRSPGIGIIGVGEGTTPNFPAFLFDELGVDPREFFEEVHPIWKRGIHFIWGPRGQFPYAFGNHYSVADTGFTRPNGYHSWDRPYESGFISSLMLHNKVFLPDEHGHPRIDDASGYHLENHLLATWLEKAVRKAGIPITEAEVSGAGKEEGKITCLHLKDGRSVKADFYVDASGFRSELLRGTLLEPFQSFADALICDRAVIGGWQRPPGDPIQPYTTAETMPAGWSWRIDHENHINRGYVYSSAFTGDEAAEHLFRQKNPAVEKTRVVPFTSGHYSRAWVGNVCAVGNSAGFVEPMEATALMVLCMELRALIGSLLEADMEIRPSLTDFYNRFFSKVWQEIRDFLAIHYKFNTLLDTPFWKHCQESTPLGGAERIVDFYRENGPSRFGHEFILPTGSQFGIEGWWALLVGQKVPWQGMGKTNPAELHRWQQRQIRLNQAVGTALTTEQTLAIVRRPEYWT